MTFSYSIHAMRGYQGRYALESPGHVTEFHSLAGLRRAVAARRRFGYVRKV